MFTKIATAIGIVAAALVAGGLGSNQASAMTPAQSTEAGVVNLLGGYTAGYTAGSIDDFWRRTLPGWGAGYSKPALRYFGNGSGGYYDTPCGSTYPVRGENGMYCRANSTIYLDYWGQQGLLTRLGDHGAGGFLAHEWAHRAQHHLGTMRDNFRGEYNADCMAGLYTRYGYSTGRLSGNDLWEFYNWLYSRTSSVSHGTGPNRAEWFRYGYNQYSKAACDSAFSLASSGYTTARTSSRSARMNVLPPKSGPVDLTPPASKALPTDNGSSVVTPPSQKVPKTTPLS